MLKKVVLTATILLFVISTGRAQQTSGTYTMFAGGNAIGAESYTMDSRSDGTVRVEAEHTIGGDKRKTTTTVSRSGWVSFLAESGETRLMSAALDNSVVTLQIVGQKERQVPTKSSMILENAVWHHLIFLLNRYDVQKGGVQTFTSFIPSQGTDHGLSVERSGTQSYQVDGKQVSAERYRLVTNAGSIVEIWTDLARTPLLIVIETQGVKVVRGGSEMLAKAALKPTVAEDWLSEEVTFQNGDVSFGGTLTIPKGAQKRYPAALLISGSGSQNRDGNPGTFGFYKLIAEKLTASGVVVLRHDDRGTGKSAMPKAPTNYRDLINDSKAAIQYLRSRDEVDPDRIVLIGHSEGGTTATIIASEDPKIAGIALLAGAIVNNFEQLLHEQTIYQKALKAPFNPKDQGKYPQVVGWLVTQIAEAKAGKPDSAPSDLHEYLRQHLALNLSETSKRVHCPVLILQGERDELVLARHAVATARMMSDAGNKQVTLRVFPNLSHVFTPSARDESIAADRKNQISPEVLETIQTWIGEVGGTGKDTQGNE